jgi:hypothetical protein
MSWQCDGLHKVSSPEIFGTSLEVNQQTHFSLHNLIWFCGYGRRRRHNRRRRHCLWSCFVWWRHPCVVMLTFGPCFVWWRHPCVVMLTFGPVLCGDAIRVLWCWRLVLFCVVTPSVCCDAVDVWSCFVWWRHPCVVMLTFGPVLCGDAIRVLWCWRLVLVLCGDAIRVLWCWRFEVEYSLHFHDKMSTSSTL